MPRILDACPACHERAVLRPPTTDCACRVCEACATRFLDLGQCGCCGILFTDDDDPEVA